MQDTPKDAQQPGTPIPTDPEPNEPREPMGGFLVLKLKDGEGATVSDERGQIEVRLCNARQGRADVAIRAPRSRRIRKIESP